MVFLGKSDISGGNACHADAHGASVAAGTRPRARRPALTLACVLLFAFAGCTNNLLQKAQNLTNNVTGGNPLAGIGGGGGNTSGLVLSNVLLDTYNPTSTLDLIGDGSGAMGQDCQPQANGGGAPGATTCTCAYTYIQSNGVQIGPVEVDTIYHENDMLRCQYTVVPPGTPYVQVYIHLTNSDTKSNTVTLNLSTNSASGLDPANPLSYTKVERYQCRDIVFVPYLWQGADLYDPFVSEDPKYSYPLNFYTTNMGLTFSEYTDAGAPWGPVTSWNCPPLPNDTSDGMDLTLYSVAADSSGSKSIFPPGGAFDRSTFYLANAPAGVFTMPVNAFVLPIVASAVAPTGQQGPAGAPPPIGYAASAIPLSGGGETCPDSSVVIPPNYHWAKLWLFRTQLPQRSYPVSNNLLNFGSSQIACNSPPWKVPPLAAPPNDTLFTDCSGEPNVAGLNNDHLAARFSLATGQCFNIIPGGATNPTTGTNWDGATNQCPWGTDSLGNIVNMGSTSNYATQSFLSYAVGTDIWIPTHKDPTNGCGGTNATDISHACQQSTGNVPWDAGDLGLGAIDTVQQGSRYDYLFVVSPPSVNSSDMNTTATSSTHAIYTPVRFMSPTDCKSSDPDQPTFPGDCSPTRMLTYGIVASGAGEGGQVGSNDPLEPGSFPMCVLQPN